ncbi:MAG: PEP/pyruvate-binding domain-containing protein [Myxococcota bacterium]
MSERCQKDALYIRWFQEIRIGDVDLVGGKNASLGELTTRMQALNVPIPPGFATTAAAYREFVRVNRLEQGLRDALAELARAQRPLEETGATIRSMFLAGQMPQVLVDELGRAYEELVRRCDRDGVAVRSSATAEDLPEASFAGQQDSFLNVRGEQALLEACRACFASLFTDLAIAYRNERGFDHMKAALSVGVQTMVAADRACAGVMFTLDTETGFPNAVVINASWGFGESVVRGSVNPDEYWVFKDKLDEADRVPII